MRTCEIFHVPRRKNSSYAWKWRYVGPDGTRRESEHEYPLFYDCVAAARASGYEPRGLIPAPA